jgi:hypothetical protein
MNNSELILSITLCLILVTSFIAASHKSGYTLFLLWSSSKDQAKYEVDRSKITTFVRYAGLVLLANAIYAFLITRDMTIIVQFSILSTLSVAYALSYYKLLKKK